MMWMMPPVRFVFFFLSLSLRFVVVLEKRLTHISFSHLSLFSRIVVIKNSRKDSKVCQWETPKELKGGLQKNLRICPLEATLLPQNTMPESGWVELTTASTTNAASSIDKHNDNNKEGKKESRTEEEKTQTANAKSSSKKKYYWHPASKQVTWQRPRRGEHEVQEAEILPLQFISESAQ
jgi:hypothetical protein